MNIRDINSAIMFGNFSNTELDSIIDAVRFSRAAIAKRNKRSMTVGSTVQFTSTKNGITYSGTVEKIAVKFITVNTGTGRWRVPANMLQIIA